MRVKAYESRGPGNGFSRRAGMDRSSEILAPAMERHSVGRRTDTNFKGLAKGEDGEANTDAQTATSHCIRFLAGHLRAWQRQTSHAKTEDLFSRVSERRAGSRSTLPASSLTTGDRLPSKSECKLQTRRSSGSTTYVVARYKRRSICTRRKTVRNAGGAVGTVFPVRIQGYGNRSF